MKRLYLVPFGREEVTGSLFSCALSLVGNKEQGNESILYIAPTPRKVREAMKVFASIIQKRSFIPPRLLTLKGLAQELYFSAGDKVLLPDYLKPVFIATFHKEKRHLSYYYHIGELVKDLKQAMLFEEWEKTKETIRENFASFPEERANIERVLEVIEEYQMNLSRRGFIDSEDLLKEAASLVEKRGKNWKGVLIIDGFIDLTKLEEFFLSRVIASFESVLASAYYDADYKEVYSLPKEFYDFLLRNGDFEVVIQNREREVRGGELGFYEFPSREEEVCGIAQEIKSSFASGRLRLAETIVTFPDLSLYAPIVERVFTKYKIPFTLYPPRPLIASPVIIPVVSLLQAVRDDYPRVPTTSCLSSPFFARISEKTKRLLPLLSRQRGIIKGRESWQQIGGIIQRDVNFFISQTLPLRKARARLGDFIKELKRVLEELGWLASLKEPIEDFLFDKKEFFSILERMSYLGDAECSFSEFVEFVESCLRFHLPVPEKEERGVRVLGLLETRGLACESIFFGGLVEESLPSALRREVFLPDWLRKKLSLLDLERHQNWQRLHFKRVLNVSRKPPFLSYPRQEGDRLLLPSPFLEGEAMTPPPRATLFTEEERDRLSGSCDILSFIKPVDFSSDTRVLNRLKKKFRHLPVTGLEKMRRCPYLFYLEDVLGLSISEETRFEVEAREWGDLVHRVLEKLYAIEVVPLEEISRNVEEILSAILAERGLPPFWQDVAKRIFSKLLPDFINEERRLREAGFSPYKTEERVQGKILGVLVSGKIDRLDKQGETFAILDYKTGGTEITRGDIARGSHLQLPLYSYLLRKRGTRITRFGIYSFRERSRVKWLAEGEEEVARAEENSLQFAKDALRQILRGRFPACGQSEQVCRFCAYRFLCR